MVVAEQRRAYRASKVEDVFICKSPVRTAGDVATPAAGAEATIEEHARGADLAANCLLLLRQGQMAATRLARAENGSLACRVECYGRITLTRCSTWVSASPMNAAIPSALCRSASSTWAVVQLPMWRITTFGGEPRRALKSAKSESLLTIV